MKKIFLTISMLLLTAACSKNISSQNVASSQSLPVAQVVMKKYKFIPQVLEVKVGQTINWVNQEKRQYHSVWFEQKGEDESEYLFPGDSLEKKFSEPGEYEYRCGPHPEMIGKIIVR